jgi:hypothetical protein
LIIPAPNYCSNASSSKSDPEILRSPRLPKLSSATTSAPFKSGSPGLELQLAVAGEHQVQLVAVLVVRQVRIDLDREEPATRIRASSS